MDRRHIIEKKLTVLLINLLMKEINRLNDLTGLKILIVDDAPENIDILSEALSKYKRLIATNGEKALKLALGENKPDLILLDIEMPGMDGYEVCRKLKANEKTKKIPVIFLTSRSDRKDIIKGFQLGSQDYITKPFDIEELISRVNTHLELKLSRDKLESVNQFLEEQVALRTRELNNANKKLEKAIRELEVLDVSKTEFLDMLSHEIRTPLNGILGSLMLLKNIGLSDEMSELFGLLEESIKRLEKFSYQALEITNLRTKGAEALKNAEINLRLLIDNCSEELSEELTNKKIELDVRHPSDEPLMKGDSEFIKKTFGILIGNAVKHSPYNEVIKVEGSIQAESIEYKIIDKGKGFAKRVLDNDLNPMILGEKHIDQNVGLDLHYARLVMNVHSGKIKIGNNESGGGAFVRLEFPIRTS